MPGTRAWSGTGGAMGLWFEDIAKSDLCLQRVVLGRLLAAVNLAARGRALSRPELRHLQAASEPAPLSL